MNSSGSVQVVPPSSFIRHSMAAASFDAVISFALAYDEIFSRGEFADDNITSVLNETLSQLQINGLAVSNAWSLNIGYSRFIIRMLAFIEISPFRKITRFQIQCCCVPIYR